MASKTYNLCPNTNKWKELSRANCSDTRTREREEIETSAPLTSYNFFWISRYRDGLAFKRVWINWISDIDDTSWDRIVVLSRFINIHLSFKLYTLEEPSSNNWVGRRKKPPAWGFTKYPVTTIRTYSILLTVITSTSSVHKLPLLGSCRKRNIQIIQYVDSHHQQRQYFIPSLDALSMVVSKINQNLSN